MKIFVSVGHGGLEDQFRDPGAIAADTTEGAELIATRDLVVLELKSRNLTVVIPDENLNLTARIEWINARGEWSDVAVEINMNAFDNPDVRGASAYYIAMNSSRKRQADLLITNLIARIPELPNRGSKPDTAAALGRLAFCRDIIPSSLVVELGFLTNPQDLRLLQDRRRDYAIALADGLQAWLAQVTSSSTLIGLAPATPDLELATSSPSVSIDSNRNRSNSLAVQTIPVKPTTLPKPPSVDTAIAYEYAPINIKLNGQINRERGILVAGNAYVPESVLIALGIDVFQIISIRRVKYKNIVYIQAIALRDFDVSVAWDIDTRTVILKTIFKVCIGQIDQIMGYGNASEEQMLLFLKENNPQVLSLYANLPRLYREEALIEGINHDVAFCQMCLETNFLMFGGSINPKQNNFANLLASGALHSASFSNQRTGVCAQIQQLKAYASTAPLMQPALNLSMPSIPRGTVPRIRQLTGRWTSDSNYGTKIIAILRRLYEFIRIL